MTPRPTNEISLASLMKHIEQLKAAALEFRDAEMKTNLLKALGKDYAASEEKAKADLWRVFETNSEIHYLISK